MLGDANGDGKVTAIDYMRIKNNIMGSSNLASTNRIAADVNRDDRITAIDYMKIKNYIKVIYNKGLEKIQESL